MSKQDPAEQVRFLVSCIGHTTNGRPDFTLVAEELGIVTKAAAQKRYERMLKANGVNSSKPTAAKSDAGDDKAPTTPVKRKPAGASGGSAKKKAKASKKEESDDDMKDPKLVSKPAKGVKKEPKREPKKEPKKEPKDEYESPLSDAPDSGADSDAGTSFDSA
ncbi:hypothetical protein TGAM01_v210630 [Trichoderma gamsii]|uniref:Myb-like DNA-binding domain-containing protein n=1 Tax=Trichoderma gamsii TaxID=398673 RepID=A0A2P4Z8A7_9HYPO|nr:hypothetical protein TGAM01_v210630 [Trichoderma gamsii]PON20528.1 hypothetical protein TGAM01_v210630 [Trichoderma gamsii]